MKNQEELRFEFGQNWNSFSEKIDHERLEIAKESLMKMFNVGELKGKTFLDVGCGSGLFSLAAVELGASVTSFDYDTEAVQTALKIRRDYNVSESHWKITSGSILDGEFISNLGKFDFVYCWGVAHHTGAMWLALSNLKYLVNQKGRLFIAIYNDQGFKSRIWWLIKYFYCSLPNPLKTPFVILFGMLNLLLIIFRDTLKVNFSFLKKLLNYKRDRGMSLFTDLRDWYGGFPYEYASFDRLKHFFVKDGFSLKEFYQETSIGCHELVFQKEN